ncbi:MAG: hypothetical protein KKD39_04210 [Candidatus Altiarchaeota archaeon]|nr:hypothetical protein [Candidatus Altiarchaeota archaeon]
MEEHWIDGRLFRVLNDGRTVEVMGDGSTEENFMVGGQQFDSYSADTTALENAAEYRSPLAGQKAQKEKAQVPGANWNKVSFGNLPKKPVEDMQSTPEYSEEGELVSSENVAPEPISSDKKVIDSRLSKFKSNYSGVVKKSVKDMLAEVQSAHTIGGMHSLGGGHDLGGGSQLASKKQGLGDNFRKKPGTLSEHMERVSQVKEQMRDGNLFQSNPFGKKDTSLRSRAKK